MKGIYRNNTARTKKNYTSKNVNEYMRFLVLNCLSLNTHLRLWIRTWHIKTYYDILSASYFCYLVISDFQIYKFASYACAKWIFNLIVSSGSSLFYQQLGFGGVIRLRQSLSLFHGRIYIPYIIKVFEF